ncbi:hypothetical protein [Arthrospira sp. PCC 8006]|uniref:hypothetical protein n=1 Tax=Arthrospira sp. PCC 8006 TaxID=1982224 RepID=UPI00396F5593
MSRGNGFLTHHGDHCAVVRQPKIDVKRKWISDAPWRSLCCGASGANCPVRIHIVGF